MERQRREFEGDERRWRAVEAWRSAEGSVLVHLLPLEGPEGTPADDDRLDRRAGLERGRRLADLDGEELEELRASATPLTGTERRFRAPDGRPWLAQSVGPVWAEGDVASGLTGVLFSALAGEVRRVRGAGGHVGRASDERLVAWWRRAVEGQEGDGAEPGDGSGTGAPAGD